MIETGFRSGDQGGENEGKSVENRRKRSDEAPAAENTDVQGRNLPGDNTDARFLGGVFGNDSF